MLKGLRRSLVHIVEGMTGQERRRGQALRQALMDANAECQQIQRQINTLTNQQMALFAQLSQVQTERDGLQRLWEQAEVECAERVASLNLQLAQQVQQGEAEVAKVQQLLDQLQEEYGVQVQALQEQQRANQGLASQVSHWQTSYDRLNQEHLAFLQMAEEDSSRLEAENEQLRQDNAMLSQLVAELQGQMAMPQQRSFQGAEVEEAVVSGPEDWLARLKLMPIRLALVGGHQSTRRGVIQELAQSYGLENVVELEPFSQESTALNKVRAKIGNCDWVFVITGYLSHKETKTVSTLKDKGALQGKVHLLKSRGRSGVVREIIGHLLDDSGLSTVM